MADVLAFREVDGERRFVRLEDSLAVHGHRRGDPGFTIGGELREVEQWEPGSDEPTVHVMGNREEPLVVHGHIRDSLLGNVATDLHTVGNAKDLVDKITSIRRSGRLLRIVSGADVFSGLLVSAKFPKEAEGEYQYDLTFNIFNAGESKGKISAKPVSLPSSFGNLDDLVATVRKSIRIPGFSFPFDTMLDGLLSAVVNPLAAIEAIIGDAETALEDTAASLQRARLRYLQLALNAMRLRDRANDLRAFYESIGEDLLADMDVFTRRLWLGNRLAALLALQALTAAAQALGLAAEKTVLGGLSGRVYTVIDGDTVELIAARFDTTPQRVLALNPDLPVGKLVTGTRVILP